MEIRFEDYNTVLVAQVPYCLERSNAVIFKKILLTRMLPGQDVILNLEKLKNIDCFGLDVLLAVAQDALEIDSTVSLAQIEPELKIVLEVTKVYRAFRIFDTVEEAIDECQRGKK